MRQAAIAARGRVRRSRHALTRGGVLLLLATSPLAAQGVVRETGSMISGEMVIWVRATDAGVVQLFMSPGYRDAFARPLLLNAGRVKQFADSAASLSSGGRRAEQLRSADLDDGGTRLDRFVGPDSAGVRVERGGTVLLSVRSSPSVQLLRLVSDAARLTAQMSSAAPAPARTVAASTPREAARIASRAPVVARSADPAPATIDRALVATPTRREPPPLARPSRALPTRDVTVSVRETTASVRRDAAPRTEVAAHAAKAVSPSRSVAKPEPARAAPEKREAANAAPATPAAPRPAKVEPVRAASPPTPTVKAEKATTAPVIAKEAPRTPAATPSSAPPALPPPSPAITPSVSRDVPRDIASHDARPAVATQRAPAAPKAALIPAPPPAIADKHIRTPLGPFVIPGSVMSDHETAVRYCYTQLGVRYDSRLTGDLTVRVTVGASGRPDTVEVVRRTWDGVPAAEVEACMRALIADWPFPPPDGGSTARVLELRITFSPKAVTIDKPRPAAAGDAKH